MSRLGAKTKTLKRGQNADDKKGTLAAGPKIFEMAKKLRVSELAELPVCCLNEALFD